ncbi:MAG: glycosyltransferase [Caldilineaceae bacterium]
MKRPGIVLILSGFPRRSETFALQEALALYRRGLLTAIFATKSGDGLPPQPGCEELLAQVQLLPAGAVEEQAAVIVQRLIGEPVAGIHAYFAHTPTAVAMQVAQELGVPYGFSMHAKDARKVTPAELNRRARGAACVVACNPDVARAVTDPNAPIRMISHGVDLERFSPQPLPAEPPLRLLAVGRLVEKKGFDTLLRAVTNLKFPYTLSIIGDGPEKAHLGALIEQFGLQERVSLHGGVTHAELPNAYAQAHIVVVPSVVDRSGDRDGLPNVLLEALACGRPVVASDIAAIDSAISHDATGLLTPPGEPVALAAALNRLAGRPDLRAALALNGYQLVARKFDLQDCSSRFCGLIEKIYKLEPKAATLRSVADIAIIQERVMTPARS